MHLLRGKGPFCIHVCKVMAMSDSLQHVLLYLLLVIYFICMESFACVIGMGYRRIRHYWFGHTGGYGAKEDELS